MKICWNSVLLIFNLFIFVYCYGIDDLIINLNSVLQSSVNFNIKTVNL